MIANGIVARGASVTGGDLLAALKSASVTTKTIGEIMRTMTEVPGGWCLLTDVTKAASEVAGLTGVTPSIVSYIAMRETEAVEFGGQIYLNPQTINHLGYKGLFQFDKKGNAWDTARNSRYGRGLPPFEKGWNDPAASAKAASALAAVYFETFRKLTKYTGPMTPELAYMCHNQGPGGAAKVVTSGASLLGKQSREVTVIARIAQRQFTA